MIEDIQTINCSFTNQKSLYLAYMPFIKGGGLFIRSNQNFALGMKVILFVNLMNEPEILKIEAKIVWLTPQGAQGNKPAGIGVQFMGNNSQYFCNKIETYLADMLKSIQATDTM